MEGLNIHHSKGTHLTCIQTCARPGTWSVVLLGCRLTWQMHTLKSLDAREQAARCRSLLQVCTKHEGVESRQQDC